jgi:Zn-dependent alcohol dehydrogenase
MRIMQSRMDVPIEKMITHQYPLTEVNQALQSHVDLSAMVPVVNHTLG